jgi:uncharacterized protein (DUF488 family)
MIKLFTIGFTKKTAQHFFETLINNDVRKLIDIRINNRSQLAGFAKGSDLAYFTKAIANIEYEYIPDFAPTKELLSDYQNKRIDWTTYQKTYRQLIEQRNILTKYDGSSFDHACFLCSEETPEHCHRRLLTEFFQKGNSDIQIIHLI